MADIRRLEVGDAAVYQALRLEALERHPEAFGSSVEDERLSTTTAVSDRLARSVVFGAFDGGRLVGTAGWYRMAGAKTAHRGKLWGVYVTASARGNGLAQALVERVLDDARGQVEQLHLSVTAGDDGSLRLYERLGFRSYGTEPRALKVDGAYFDELLMVRELA